MEQIITIIGALLFFILVLVLCGVVLRVGLAHQAQQAQDEPSVQVLVGWLHTVQRQLDHLTFGLSLLLVGVVSRLEPGRDE